MSCNRNEGDGTFTDVTDLGWGSGSAVEFERGFFLTMTTMGTLRSVRGQQRRFHVCYQQSVRRLCGDDPFGGCWPSPSAPVRIARLPTTEAVPDALFHNEGDGTFTDVSTETGIADLAGKGLGVVAWDFDADGDQDVFVANDGMENYLFRNDGDGTFTDVALQVGAAFNADGDDEACMGVDFGDYDNDGDFDLFVTNFSHETNTPLPSNEGGRFKDVTEAVGLGRPSWALFWAFGTNFLDYDNDGDLDLYVGQWPCPRTRSPCSSPGAGIRPRAPALCQRWNGPLRRGRHQLGHIGSPSRRSAGARPLATTTRMETSIS